MVEIFTWLKKHLKKKLVASDLYTDVDMIHLYILYFGTKVTIIALRIQNGE